MIRCLLVTLAFTSLVHASAQNLVSFDLVTDEYGSETIWQLNGQGTTIHIQGGYADNIGSPSNPQPTITLDLADGTYMFCMSDVNNDGFCCGYGQGSMTITHAASGTVLYQNDTFNTDITCFQFVVPFSKVTGRLFLDDDNDCVHDAGEPVLAWQPVKVSPGGHHGITDANGDYAVPVPYGTYTVIGASSHLVPICPAVQPVSFTVSDVLPFSVVDLGDSVADLRDLVATAASGPARPGFQMQYIVAASNISPLVTGPVTTQFTFDPALGFISASPAPASVSGNVITWNSPPLQAFEQVVHHVALQVPVPIPLGTDLVGTVSASQTLFEQDLLNNTGQVHTPVTGSFDPNDKVVWPRDGFVIGADTVLDYTIRFQNTGTDTAFTVVITDTLDADLDMGTFEQGVASHPFSISFKPGRVVEWRFANILLPDSNTNEPLSHGLVTFRIRPVQPVLPGTEYRNNADIFFDFNPPVRTNDAVVVAETSTQVQLQGQAQGQGMLVFPNPVNDELGFSMPSGAGPYRVEVIGAEGRLYLTTRTDIPTVDVSVLPTGIYAIRVNGSVARFVKR